MIKKTAIYKAVIKLMYYGCVAILVFVTTAGYSQTETFEVQYQKAMQLWRDGHDKDAIQSLEDLTEANPDSIVLYPLLGQMEFQSGNVGKAKDWFEKAEKRSSKDLTVPYYLALCYRETGKNKALIMRRNDWEKSESYFRQVTKKVPGYQQVFYQWAVLERYRGNYKEAVRLAEKQLELKPKDAKSHLGLYAILDLYLEYKDPKEWFDRRKDCWSDFFKAEYLRRQGRFAEAERALQDLIHDPDSLFSIIPVYLSLARSYAQNDKMSLIGHVWDQILANLKSSIDVAFLFDDMKYVFSDKELDSFARMNTLKQVRSFFELFWKRRDPIPAAPQNLRLAEHFNRMAVAEEKYRFDGFRLWFNNPDKLQHLQFPQSFWLNDKFNDKGLIYLRHGEPDERAADVGPNIPTNESWLYYATRSLPKLMFHFFIDENAVGNNWRLTAKLPRSLMASRLTWDHIYQRIYTGNDLEFFQYQTELAEMSKHDVWLGMDSDRHTWQEEIEPLHIPFYIASFQDSLQVRRELYYGLPVSKWKKDSIDVVEFALLVEDTLLNTIFQRRYDFYMKTLDSRVDENGYWTDQINFKGSDEKYRYNIFVRAKHTSRLEGYSFYHQAPDWSELSLSDIELATDVLVQSGESIFDKDSLTVIPNARRVVERGSPFYIYYEIYNIPLADRGTSDYTVEYRFKRLEGSNTNIFSRVWQWIAGSREQAFTKTDRNSHTSVSKEYMAFDLGDRKIGEYELSITVQIADTEQSAEQSLKFELK